MSHRELIEELVGELEYFVEMLAVGAMPSGSDITTARAVLEKVVIEDCIPLDDAREAALR